MSMWDVPAFGSKVKLHTNEHETRYRKLISHYDYGAQWLRMWASRRQGRIKASEASAESRRLIENLPERACSLPTPAATMGGPSQVSTYRSTTFLRMTRRRGFQGCPQQCNGAQLEIPHALEPYSPTPANSAQGGDKRQDVKILETSTRRICHAIC